MRKSQGITFNKTITTRRIRIQCKEIHTFSCIIVPVARVSLHAMVPWYLLGLYDLSHDISADNATISQLYLGFKLIVQAQVLVIPIL
jgi:hypothetical protein